MPDADALIIPVRRFLGGMNIDRPLSRNARTNATMPLATLRINEQAIQIAAIPPFRRLLPSTTVDRPQVTAIYRSKGLILTPGVAVETASSTHYFWTWRGAVIIEQLAAMGYPTTTPRRPSLRVLMGRRVR